MSARFDLIKPSAYRNRKYLAWIRTWTCLVADSACNLPVEAAHTGEHGLGTKASDIQTLPLCAFHHRGTVGLDTLGPMRFEQEFNVDLKGEVLKRINLYLGTGGTL